MGLYKWHEGKPVLNAAGEQVLDTGAAAAMQLKAREASLPYWHSRMPQAVVVEERKRGLLVIQAVDGSSAGDVPFVFGEPQSNQQVIDSDPVQSDGTKSETKSNQRDGAQND